MSTAWFTACLSSVYCPTYCLSVLCLMSGLPPVCPRLYCTVYCLSVLCLLSGLLPVCPLLTARFTACLLFLFAVRLTSCLSSVYCKTYRLSVLVFTARFTDYPLFTVRLIGFLSFVYCPTYCLSVLCLLSDLLPFCPLFNVRLTACVSSCLLHGLLPVCPLFTVRPIACLFSVYCSAYCLFHRLYSLFPSVCLTSLSVDSSQCVANLHAFSLSPGLSVSACTLPNCAGGIV